MEGLLPTLNVPTFYLKIHRSLYDHLGTDSEINQGVGWLMFQVRSHICS